MQRQHRQQAQRQRRPGPQPGRRQQQRGHPARHPQRHDLQHDVAQGQGQQVDGQFQADPAGLAQRLPQQTPHIGAHHGQTAALPALALAARTALGGDQLGIGAGLVDVHHAIAAQAQHDAVLQVFRHRVDIERHLAQQRMGHTHAVAPQAAGGSQTLARAAAHRMESPVGHGDQAGTPRVVGIEHPVVDLHHLGAGLDARGIGRQQIGRDLGVRIDHRHSLGETIGGAARNSVLQRIALAAPHVILALDHPRAGGPRQRRGVVAAVVGDDHDAKVFARPVHRSQTTHGTLDHGGFIVRRHQDVESQRPLARPGTRQPRRQHGQHAEIERSQRHGKGHDGQDQMQNNRHGGLRRTLGNARPTGWTVFRSWPRHAPASALRGGAPAAR